MRPGRCFDGAHVEADGVRMDGANGANAAGVDGKGVDVDGARGVGARARGVRTWTGVRMQVHTVDGARGKVNGMV